MGAGDLEVLDLFTASDSDDEPRLQVGDVTSGKGVGTDCAYLANDGFISQPNPPDGTGAAASAVVWTPGNDRFVIAAMDGRSNAKAGMLAAGDRAIVSNCDAAFKLTQAANTVQLLALLQSMEITLDASAGKLTLKVPSASIVIDANAQTVAVTAPNTTVTLGASGVFAQFFAGGVLSQLGCGATAAQLVYDAPGASASVVCSPAAGGTVAVTTAPGQFLVNGVAVP